MSNLVEVLITLPFSEELIQRLSAVSPRLHLDVHRARKADEIDDETWERVEVLYTNRVLPRPEQVPNLRWIQFHWAGIDHAVGAPILQAPGILATTLSGANATQVAEHIVMMLLALGHHLPDLLTAQRRGEWPKDRWERFSPSELRERIVGIVGYGSIGRQVAHLLNGFGARVFAIKNDVMHPTDQGYIPSNPGYVLGGYGDAQGDFAFRLYPPQALHAMLKECDFVLITVPLTNSTRNLINAEALAVMKPTAYLVDTSRGGVVDHAALAIALREHRLAGAALDVFPEEPLPDDSPLWKISNVILTPHISGNTPFYDERAVDLFSQNLRRYLAGQSLLNVYNLKRGY